jgi:hypothetical protein
VKHIASGDLFRENLENRTLSFARTLSSLEAR